MHRAPVIGGQKLAGASGLFLQRQLRAIAGQCRVPLDEFFLGDLQVSRQRGQIVRRQQDRARPTATSPAMLTLEKGFRHGPQTNAERYCIYMRSPPGPMLIGFFSSCNSQATLMLLIQAMLRARWKTL